MRQLKITRSITNRESDSLDRYLSEIGKVELITAEEEVRLAILIRGGDTDALEKLTKANLRFVVSVAKQYQSQGLSLSDLINEGNLGLIKAAQRFDETRGFKFISYAVWWIRQSIMQAIAEHSRIVRLPMNQLSTLNKINRAFVQLEQEHEREPSPEEMAMLMNVDVTDVLNSLGMAGRHVSVDAPFANGEEGSLMDVIPNDHAEAADKKVEHNDSLHCELERLLNSLTSREAQVLRCFYGIGMEQPMCLADIAAQFDVTSERVRQLRDKSVRKLKSMSSNKLLRAYLG